jgi:hypothetical protein
MRNANAKSFLIDLETLGRPRYARISIWPLGQLEKPNLHRTSLHK